MFRKLLILVLFAIVSNLVQSLPHKLQRRDLDDDELGPRPVLAPSAVRKCGAYGNDVVARGGSINYKFTYIVKNSMLYTGRLTELRVWPLIDNYEFRLLIFQQVMNSDGRIEFEVKHAISYRTSQKLNEPTVVKVSPPIEVQTGWYAGLSTQGTREVLPIAFNRSVGAVEQGWELTDEEYRSSRAIYKSSDKIFSFHVKICPYEKPVIQNPEDCNYIGRPLRERSNKNLDDNYPSYLNIMNSAEMIIPLLPLTPRYMHSVWMYVSDPTIAIRIYLYQKVGDRDTAVFTVKAFRVIPEESLHVGINQIDLYQDLESLVAMEECAYITNDTSSACSVRIGLMFDSNTESPLEFDLRPSVYDWEHPVNGDYLPTPGSTVTFREKSTREFSVGMILCSGKSPQKAMTSTRVPGGEETDVVLIAVAASVSVLAALLIALVIWLIVWKLRRSAKTHRESGRIERQPEPMASKSMLPTTILPPPMEDSYLRNPVYMSRAVTKSVRRPLQQNGRARLFQQSMTSTSDQQTSTEYVVVEEDIEMQHVLHIQENEITYEKELKGAVGRFADAWLAKWNWNNSVQEVVIKRLRETSTASDKDLMEEKVKFMSRLAPHPHILNLIGVYKYNETMAMVMEYCSNGTLKKYLRHFKAQRKPPQKFRGNLARFCHEIAEGMAFLHRNAITHKKLWARNVLLTGDLQCKIIGFTPTAEETEEPVGQFESYEKWQAPEVTSSNDCSKSSDIWSYGVTLWELYSFGSLPPVDMREAVGSGDSSPSLPKPKDCSSNKYQELLLPCWKVKAEDRPTFEHFSQITMNYSRLNAKGTASTASHDFLSVVTRNKKFLRPIPYQWRTGQLKQVRDRPITFIRTDDGRLEPEVAVETRNGVNHGTSIKSGSTHLYQEISYENSPNPVSEDPPPVPSRPRPQQDVAPMSVTSPNPVYMSSSEAELQTSTSAATPVSPTIPAPPSQGLVSPPAPEVQPPPRPPKTRGAERVFSDTSEHTSNPVYGLLPEPASIKLKNPIYETRFDAPVVSVDGEVTSSAQARAKPPSASTDPQQTPGTSKNSTTDDFPPPARRLTSGQNEVVVKNQKKGKSKLPPAAQKNKTQENSDETKPIAGREERSSQRVREIKQLKSPSIQDRIKGLSHINTVL